MSQLERMSERVCHYHTAGNANRDSTLAFPVALFTSEQNRVNSINPPIKPFVSLFPFLLDTFIALCWSTFKHRALFALLITAVQKIASLQ